MEVNAYSPKLSIKVAAGKALVIMLAPLENLPAKAAEPILI